MFKFFSKLKAENLRRGCNILSKWMLAVLILVFLLLGNVPAQAAAMSAQLLVSDPGFTINPRNVDRQWGLAQADFMGAWDIATAKPNVVVAVVDTGVDQTHEDLRNVRFVEGFNVVASQTILPGSDTDDNGHGTVITGVIAATGNNGIGIVGAAFGVGIMPIKALDAKGNGSADNVAKAVIWATDHGAQIINLSLGGMGFEHDLNLSEAMTYAYARNVLIVAAAGNDVAASGGDMDKSPIYPICDDNGQNMILGVTALDENDLKPVFANFGKNCVDVAAPGKRVLSTINKDPITKIAAPNSYAYASGTSLAAPFVSALAALLKSAYPDASNRQIRDRIIATASPVDWLNTSQCSGDCAGKIGAGRINASLSLKEKIVTLALSEGDVVKAIGSEELFVISGGKRLPLGSFVRTQKYNTVLPRAVYSDELQVFPMGTYAMPEPGTLVKKAADPTVYYISVGQKQPVSYQVFTQRGFTFDRVFTLSDSEIDSWILGKLLPPPEGALIRSAKNKTVYWVVNGVLHPISFDFFQARGLSVFPILIFSDSDIKALVKAEPYL